jgi:hypothetical protein
MSSPSQAAQKFFGLFELDTAGTVLYSRAESEGEPDGEPDESAPDVTGRNFYDEVVPFGNVEEFRRRVVQFTQGGSPADSFRFDCQYDGTAVPVRVLLARIRERASKELTKSVLVHIRRGA